MPGSLEIKWYDNDKVYKTKLCEDTASDLMNQSSLNYAENVVATPTPLYEKGEIVKSKKTGEMGIIHTIEYDYIKDQWYYRARTFDTAFDMCISHLGKFEKDIEKISAIEFILNYSNKDYKVTIEKNK